MTQEIYIPYWLWEEWKGGLWRSVSGEERERLLQTAINFTSDTEKYGKYMIKALAFWPNSCAYNLSKIGVNRQAWIGHAACCIATYSPEDITREAWHYLTQEQQDKANSKADKAIALWESRFSIGVQSCQNLG